MHLRPDHIRALAAAAGLVGRPRLRAGLLLTLAAGCHLEIVDSGGATVDLGSTMGPESTGAIDPSTGHLTTTVTSTGDASTSSATTLDDTGGGTLLTDATTFASTSTGDGSTGDASTGGDSTSDTGGSSGSTGDLSDCVDPRSGRTDWDCCEAQNWEPHPQCTPWGPPAPPSATAARLQRAREAQGRFV